jgi:hypothetical protein
MTCRQDVYSIQYSIQLGRYWGFFSSFPARSGSRSTRRRVRPEPCAAAIVSGGQPAGTDAGRVAGPRDRQVAGQRGRGPRTTTGGAGGCWCEAARSKLLQPRPRGPPAADSSHARFACPLGASSPSPSRDRGTYLPRYRQALQDRLRAAPYGTAPAGHPQDLLYCAILRLLSLLVGCCERDNVPVGPPSTPMGLVS